MANEDEILIGEGVMLDIATATVGTRIVSGLIDLVAWGIFITMSAFVLAWALPLAGDDAMGIAFVSVWIALVFVGYPVAFETLTRGRSPGKFAMGIRIVRDDGGPIGFRQALTRGLLGIVDFWISGGSVAMLSSLLSARSKRVGDMLAGTYAARIRAPKARHTALHVHPHLLLWSTTVDIRRLPDGLALTIRQFLTRAATLSPAARESFGNDLARRVAPFVAPAAPEGTHPETFLMAVMAVRRDREYAISMRNQQEDTAHASGVARLPFGVPDADF